MNQSTLAWFIRDTAPLNERARFSGVTMADMMTPRKEMAVTDGIAHIAVSGTLGAGMPAIYSKVFGDTQYEALSAELGQAAASTVKSVVLHINSPGGMATGCREIYQQVSALASKKPVTALIEAEGCSAAYYIASAAGRILARPSAIVGSIGTVMTVHDMSALFEKAGVKAEVFASGEYKGAGAPGTSLSDKQRKFLADFVNELAGQFKSDVTAKRRIAAADMQGQFFTAETALKKGFLDGISIETSQALGSSKLTKQQKPELFGQARVMAAFAKEKR